MSSAEFVDLLTQLGVMLVVGVALGFVMRKLKQPSVVGEMAAGVLIGVTVLGSIAPDVYDWLFDSGDLVTSTRGDIIKVGMLFFLYVAGSEVELSDVKTLGRRSLIIGLVGTVLPIAGGIALVYATPMSLWGESVGIGRLPFAAFIGMNLANSANPVLARILIDLGLMKSRIATVMMTATVVDDLVNWTLYAIILGSVSTGAASSSDRGLGVDLLLVALLFIVVLGGIRWLAPHMVSLARRHLAWPNGYVVVASVTVIAVSAVSEAIGVQAFLGAFLAGVAFSGVAAGEGATGHKSLVHVSIGFFAPLFFVSMALRTDFIEAFDPVLVLTVVVFALISKLVSVLVGVKAAGLPIGREAWAMAWGLNARGATGIILAATGLQAGIIDDEVFVALVVMAIATSILAGPMMVRALGPLRKDMTDEEELPDEGADSKTAAQAYAARLVDRDLTEAERAELGSTVLYRVLVAIDDPATARPLVEVAAELAASQQPSEVVLASFEKQPELETKGMFSVLDAIASELDSLRGLEEIVQAEGVSAVSVSKRSTDLAADIAAEAQELGAHALVVGDRRDDPEWVEIVDGLIAGSPADIYVVVAPRPRLDAPARTGAPVLEAGEGLPGEAALEAAARFALGGSTGPIVVGVGPKAKAARPYRDTLDRLARLDRPGRIEEAGLATIEGAAAAADAPLVVRAFSAPEGLQPIERARPDAERFGVPLVLVAPDPDRPERSSLTTLLDEAEAALPTSIV
ncbi:MAG TPA: cation:proton antiporter [Iamia sp.]